MWKRLVLVVIDTTKVRLFKQITTVDKTTGNAYRCYWYHKGKTFQANHNQGLQLGRDDQLLLIPQR